MTKTQYVIRNKGQVISVHQTASEAENALLYLKAGNNIYESAAVVAVDEQKRELLFG